MQIQMQPMAMSPSLSMNGTSSPITYPQFPRRVSPHATGSGSPSSYIPSSYDIASPPLASISPTLSRRRSDYVDQSREVINTLAQQPQPSAVDYPNLNRTSHVLRPPPAVASGVHERQDLRLPAQPVPQNLPRIKNSEYPVSFWTDDQIGLSGLKNLGNTCYMNAPIQCLSASVPFARFFLGKSFIGPSSTYGLILLYLRKVALAASYQSHESHGVERKVNGCVCKLGSGDVVTRDDFSCC